MIAIPAKITKTRSNSNGVVIYSFLFGFLFCWNIWMKTMGIIVSIAGVWHSYSIYVFVSLFFSIIQSAWWNVIFAHCEPYTQAKKNTPNIENGILNIHTARERSEIYNLSIFPRAPFLLPTQKLCACSLNRPSVCWFFSFFQN